MGKNHMKSLAETWHYQKGDMTERVRARPPMTFWSKDERDRIEDARQDPDEAKQRMTAYMRDRAREYRDHKRDMTERVNCLPAKTFRRREERERMDSTQCSHKIRPL